LLVLAAVLFPVLLSLSFGVIGAMVMALLIGTVAFAGKLPKIYWSFLFYTTIFMAGIVLIVWLSWPGNPVFMRIENILTGTDTSARGRLFNSFWFAWDLIKTHNLFMGVGPGQVKILAHDLIVNYYQYSGEYAEIVRIPNSMGETLAIYGIYGFVLKLFLELYFFIRFKLYNNYFNLVLFLFIFIYQFTGSFLINVAELGVWVIAFNARFPEFEIDSLKGSAT
jgi:O-antigen ligase